MAVPPDLTLPVAFPDNFPDEAFYWSADAFVDTNNGGSAALVLALEAAFAQGLPAEGDQMVFARLRIRIDNLVAGETYTITHPYGVETLVAEETGPNGINTTIDIGAIPGGFDVALGAPLGPFLQWDPAESSPPVGYVGDPGIPHTVIGSPLGTNYFRVEGLDVGGPGVNVVETDLFNISGRFYNGRVPQPLAADRATLTRTADSAFLAVFARSVGTAKLEVSAPGLPTTPMLVDPSSGRFFVSIPVGGLTIPSYVFVSNLADDPVTAVTRTVVDEVNIEDASYDISSRILQVVATSSDEVGLPRLSVTGYGDLNPLGELAVGGVAVPPPSIEVVSALGGVAVRDLRVFASGVPAPPAPVANAGVDQTVDQGTVVTLTGAGSTGSITGYLWTQLTGPAVSLSDPTAVSPTFTFPLSETTLLFELLVTGPGGSSTAQVAIKGLPVAPPLANAGPDLAVLPGSTVTLSALASQGTITDYLWTQTGGTAVVLSDPTAAQPTFVFPQSNTTLTFELMALGPGGATFDTVQVSAQEVLVMTRVEYRASRREWRIEGVTSHPGSIVSAFNGPTLNGTLIGRVQADNLGNFQIRQRNSTVTPSADGTVSVSSSSGGVLLAVPVNISAVVALQ